MRDEIAALVNPVITQGLRLKERLERGDNVDFYNEQSQLKGMLLGELEARRIADYGGDMGSASVSGRGGGGGGRPRSPDSFLGIRYILTCWLDEIFIIDSPWESLWNERKIEESLYGTNDRAWMFWEQAQLAESRPGTDPLEVMYLCVMLGFRGDLRERPDQLRAWADAAGKRIAREQGREWPVPPEIDPPVNVPPLRGREKLHRMVLTVAVFTFGLVPIITFFILTQILRQ